MSETKEFKKFNNNINSLLTNLAGAASWSDLLPVFKEMFKLVKTQTKNFNYSLIKEKITLSKRLAQSLSPECPGGVHEVVIEIYNIIIQNILEKNNGKLGDNLGLYCSGLFPFFSYASKVNKELFIEQLLNILDSPEKFKLYKIFLENHCHFITTRPAFLKKYTKDFYFTQYVILNGTTHIDTNNYDNFVKNNWADCLLHDLHASAEYNSYIYQETLHNLHTVIEIYHHILNFKNLFEVNYFTKQFWMLYQQLIFHPHAEHDNKILTIISLQRILL